MVIFIAGLIGTGKSALSEALAEKLGIFHYDVDEIKKLILPTDPNYEYNLKNNIIFSDETKSKVYRRVVEDFPRLAKQYKTIIVEDVMNNKNVRQILFDGATTYFGGYMLVWVTCNEDILKERLEKNQRPGHMLKDPFAYYLSLKKQFDDFENPDIIIENNSDLNSSLETLASFITSKIK